MTQALIVAAALAYLGVGGIYARRWFHHKDPLSVLLVILFWPLILCLSLFTK